MTVEMNEAEGSGRDSSSWGFLHLFWGLLPPATWKSGTRGLQPRFLVLLGTSLQRALPHTPSLMSR